MYDLSKRATFDNLEKWLLELRDHASSDIAITCVGNKSDLRHLRAVRTEEGEEFAAKHNLICIETSALDGQKVQDAFQETLTNIYKVMSQKQAADPGAPSQPPANQGQNVNLGTAQPAAGSGKSCAC